MALAMVGLTSMAGFSSLAVADTDGPALHSRGSNSSGKALPLPVALVDDGCASGSFGHTPADAGRDGPAGQTCPNLTSHPVLILDGNKVEVETDFQTRQPLTPLSLVRTYNHYDTEIGIFGAAWASNFDVHLGFQPVIGAACGAEPGVATTCVSASTPSASITAVTATRADGSQASYSWNAADNRYENASPDADDWSASRQQKNAAGASPTRGEGINLSTARQL